QRTGKVVLLGLIVLPTASEWSMLKFMFSPVYWREVVKRVKADAGDARFDTGSVPAEILKQVSILNPLKWMYHALLRVFYYWRYALLDMSARERLPGFLLDSKYLGADAPEKAGAVR
ncbi:MAG: hypothetical protein ABH885_07680, partial [Candidatus Omnitrophota bacterium]